MERQALKRITALAVCTAALLFPCFAAAKLAPAQTQRALNMLLAASAAMQAPAGGGEAAALWLQTQHTAPQPAAAPQIQTPDRTDSILPPAEPVQDTAALLAAIPNQRRGSIDEVHYASSSTAEGYFFYGEGCIRNASAQNSLTLAEQAALPFSLPVQQNAGEPLVLILHTHTTESFDPNDIGVYDTEHPTRSTDDEENMLAVGAAMCSRLNALGIPAVQATEYHDYPSYNGAYGRSRETVRQYLLRYPSVKIVLDLHRDGIQRQDGTRVKPTVLINGSKAAQLMLVVNADDGSGSMPYQMENLRFAARLQDALQRLYPGLARPVLFDERSYNQDLMPGYLLVEIGSESSTLQEAKYTAQLLADCLAQLLAQQG